MTHNKSYLYIIFLIIISLSACKSKKPKYDDTILIPINELYQNGLNLISANKYKEAAEMFGRIFFQYPGHPLTAQAELMQAYSLYEAAEYEEAFDVIDNFIALHPMHKDIGYAYYLKALAAYIQISNVHLDQVKTADAKIYFQDVINKFPNSKYANDSLLKIDLINEHLAGKEMRIGRYYLDKKNPVAALKRFKEVINNYQNTSHAQEALYRMTACYLQLGLIEEAKQPASILGYNYSNSKWYKYTCDLLAQFSSIAVNAIILEKSCPHDKVNDSEICKFN